MSFFRNVKFIVISILLVAGIAACEQSGPAETAGKKIDQTANKAGDAINNAADKVEDSMSDKKK